MKKTILMIAVISAAIFFYFSKQKNPMDFHSHDEKRALKMNASSASVLPGGKIAAHNKHAHKQEDNKKTPTFKVKNLSIPNTKEGVSLTKFSATLSRYTQHDFKLQELKEELINNGLRVISSHDKNKFTGEMVVIRTKNTLPGTRYFHAQVFKDDNDNDFIQHMSFEYRPGKDAFAQAVAAIKQEFKVSKYADVQKDGFYSWNLENDYVVWIKKMNEEDLKDDPFNAYTKKDIGTIRVAIEQEIHN